MNDEEYFTAIKSAPLKPLSVRSYLNNLKTVLRHVNAGAGAGEKNRVTLDMVLRDADRFFPVIVRETTAVHDKRLAARMRGGGWKKQALPDAQGTIRSQVKTLLAVLKYSGIKEAEPGVYGAWFKYFARLNEAMAVREDNNLPTLATDMTWEEIVGRRAGLKPGTLEHVTLGLYTCIPPRRQTDYFRMARTRAIYDGDPEGCTGWLDIGAGAGAGAGAGTMRVTQYKTADQYSDFECELPPELLNSIRLYLAQRDARARAKGLPRQRFLLTKLNGDPYPGVSSFTDANNNVLKRVLDNPHASVNTIRHAAASYVATSTTMLRGEKKRWAVAMGHSLVMQGHYVIARIAAGSEPPPLRGAASRELL
jgi:hypothetical protein